MHPGSIPGGASIPGPHVLRVYVLSYRTTRAASATEAQRLTWTVVRKDKQVLTIVHVHWRQNGRVRSKHTGGNDARRSAELHEWAQARERCPPVRIGTQEARRGVLRLHQVPGGAEYRFRVGPSRDSRCSDAAALAPVSSAAARSRNVSAGLPEPSLQARGRGWHCPCTGTTWSRLRPHQLRSR